MAGTIACAGRATAASVIGPSSTTIQPDIQDVQPNPSFFDQL